MRTTISIPDELYEKAMKEAPDGNFSKIVAKGLTTVVKESAAEYFIGLGGKAPWAWTTPRRPDYEMSPAC